MAFYFRRRGAKTQSNAKNTQSGSAATKEVGSQRSEKRERQGLAAGDSKPFPIVKPAASALPLTNLSVEYLRKKQNFQMFVSSKE